MKPLLLAVLVVSAFAAPPPNVRLTNDVGGGYISAYTLATGIPYTDAVIDECAKSRGRQNEPAVAINPRDSRVLIGSSNDYCGVYAGSPVGGVFVPSGPIWLGYYRSENSGASVQSSLVPGYPGDTSPYAALAHIRTAGAGDPVIAWDSHGRVYMAAEASDDPAGSKKTFGDEWVARFDNPGGEGGNTLNDGKRFLGIETVAKGSAAPNLLGKFNDKTALEVDRTGGACDGNVYFAWSRFSGNAGDVSIYFTRSADHGVTWSTLQNLSPNIHDVQDPDISVTGNGHVYVTFHQIAGRGFQPDAVVYAKSTDCGKTFSPVQMVTTFTPAGAQDKTDAGGFARDCGSLGNHCQSGYTFFRRDSAPHAASDQGDTANEYIYIVLDAAKPGTEVDTGTTYGSIGPGVGAQSGIYFMRLDGASGATTTPALIDAQSTGHQFFPDIAADAGVLHAIWWDSRNDPVYSAARPIGNDAAGKVYASLDVFAAKSTDGGATWISKSRLTGVTSNGNYEQFSNRTVPFAGDYLWVSAVGSSAYAVWTDWRNTVTGTDPREPSATDGADVKQCRTQNPAGVWSGDQCPHLGGIDQNIYGAVAP